MPSSYFSKIKKGKSSSIVSKAPEFNNSAQHVFASLNYSLVEKNNFLDSIQNHLNFIKEYIIITGPTGEHKESIEALYNDLQNIIKAAKIQKNVDLNSIRQQLLSKINEAPRQSLTDYPLLLAFLDMFRDLLNLGPYQTFLETKFKEIKSNINLLSEQLTHKLLLKDLKQTIEVTNIPNKALILEKIQSWLGKDIHPSLKDIYALTDEVGADTIVSNPDIKEIFDKFFKYYNSKVPYAFYEKPQQFAHQDASIKRGFFTSEKLTSPKNSASSSSVIPVDNAQSILIKLNVIKTALLPSVLRLPELTPSTSKDEKYEYALDRLDIINFNKDIEFNLFLIKETLKNFKIVSDLTSNQLAKILYCLQNIPEAIIILNPELKNNLAKFYDCCLETLPEEEIQYYITLKNLNEFYKEEISFYKNIDSLLNKIEDLSHHTYKEVKLLLSYKNKDELFDALKTERFKELAKDNPELKDILDSICEFANIEPPYSNHEDLSSQAFHFD